LVDPIVALFRASSGRRTLCSESVAEALRARGVEVPILRHEQAELWKRGMADGAQAAAEIVGAQRIEPQEARAGDVILIAQDGDDPLLGMMSDVGAVATSFGRLTIVSDPVVVAAWRV
jgi:predicted phage tail protein